MRYSPRRKGRPSRNDPSFYEAWEAEASTLSALICCMPDFFAPSDADMVKPVTPQQLL